MPDDDDSSAYFKGLSALRQRFDTNWDGLPTNGINTFFSGGGLNNRITGLGTFARDKVMRGTYMDSVRLPDPEVQALYHGNDIARKIIQLRPEMYFRKGYQILFTDPGADQDIEAEKALAIEEYMANLRANELIKKACIFGRMFGGTILLIGADDGLDPSLPLNEANIRSIRYMNFIDRRFLFTFTYYSDPLHPKYGEPETYLMVNSFGDQGASIVHETRLLRFDGADVDILKRRELAGWTLSVLQAPYDIMRAFDTSFLAVANLMADMSQGVFSMKNLIGILASEGGVQTTQQRMAMVDMARSSSRMLLVDAENEKFERVVTPMGGVPDTLDRFMMRLACAAHMPVTLLFGRSPAGMNATGEADIRGFYDEIESEQKNDIEPKIRRLVTLCCLAKDSPTKGVVPKKIAFKWNELWSTTKKEQAEVEKLLGDRDVAYVNAHVLTPGEVATSRFKDGEFRMQTEIDPAMHDPSKTTADIQKDVAQPPPLIPEEPGSSLSDPYPQGSSGSKTKVKKGAK